MKERKDLRAREDEGDRGEGRASKESQCERRACMKRTQEREKEEKTHWSGPRSADSCLTCSAGPRLALASAARWCPLACSYRGGRSTTSSVSPPDPPPALSTSPASSCRMNLVAELVESLRPSSCSGPGGTSAGSRGVPWPYVYCDRFSEAPKLGSTRDAVEFVSDPVWNPPGGTWLNALGG